MRPLIITLDGPAGSGKSSVAYELAKRLGLDFLDTGAMYRGLTAECLDRGLNPSQQFDAVADSGIFSSKKRNFEILKK